MSLLIGNLDKLENVIKRIQDEAAKMNIDVLYSTSIQITIERSIVQSINNIKDIGALSPGALSIAKINLILDIVEAPIDYNTKYLRELVKSINEIFGELEGENNV
jgi:hypothetical protein